MKIDISIKKVQKDFEYDMYMPNYATSGSAGMDLHACIKEPIIMKPRQIYKIPTGIAIHINNSNVGGFVFPRSGLASKHGITLVNAVGVIDSDYVGEIMCLMINLSESDYTVNPGDRIAQIVFLPVYCASLILTDELQSTERGTGGFGSTGK